MRARRGVAGGIAPFNSIVPWLRILVLASLIGSAGCFGSTHLYYSQASVQSDQRLKVPAATHNWVWGLIHGQDVVMGAACGQNGVATIEVEHTLPDWLWFIFTVGFYNRTSVTFTCQ
jgi:hypothetical protein